MLCAGQRYLADGRAIAHLNPRKAYELGLLHYSDWSDDLDFLRAGLPHNAYNGLWVGPGPSGTIAVGVPASGAAARALAERYRSDAAAILYPYPHQYSAAVPADDRVRFLLMNMRPSAFDGCVSGSAKWSPTSPR